MTDDFIRHIRIDKQSPLPLYFQLEQQIKQLIDDGAIEPGTQISTERELMAQLHLSYNTVTRAMRELVQQGILERKQGCGTFVAEKKQIHRSIAVVTPLLYQEQDELSLMDHDISSHIAHIIEPQLVHAIEMEAKEHKANIILYLDHGSVAIERQNLIDIIERKVDAAIVLSIGSDSNNDCLIQMQQVGIPLVLVDRYCTDIDTDYVGTDNYSGAVDAIGLLIDSGAKIIHYITPQPAVTSLRERLEGYYSAIKEHNLIPNVHSLPASLVIDPSVKDAYSTAAEIIQDADDDLAIFAANSEVLTGVILAILDHGSNLKSIALSSFDDPNMPIPDNTLFIEVVQALDEIGKRSVQLAINRNGSNSTHNHLRIKPTMRIIDKRNIKKLR